MMIKKLQDILRQSQSIDGALLLSPENRRYFTGFPSSDGFLLVSADRAVFVTDSRYFEAAKAAVQSCEVVLQGHDRKQLAEIFADMQVTAVGIEASRMSVAAFSEYATALAPVQLVADNTLDSMLVALRAVKTPEEILKIQAAQQIANEAFAYICKEIRPGRTEREIALALDYFMLSHGAQAISFETIVVSGANTSKPHGVPSDKPVQAGDFVTMDFGAVVDGYHSDMTRTVAVGKADSRQRAVYDVVLNAQKAVLAGLRPGLRCADADKLARDVITNAGYGEYFGHSTGHGVGIEIHERPNLAPRAESVLTVGNVVTDEPGIYLPGQFGVRIEDMALITPSGCQNLTDCPKELIIL